MLQLPIHICDFNSLLEDVVGQVNQVLKFHFSLFFIVHASRHDAGRWGHGLRWCLVFLEDAIERAKFLLWKFAVSITRSEVVLPITFDSTITTVVALPSYRYGLSIDHGITHGSSRWVGWLLSHPTFMDPFVLSRISSLHFLLNCVPVQILHFEEVACLPKLPMLLHITLTYQAQSWILNVIALIVYVFNLKLLPTWWPFLYNLLATGSSLAIFGIGDNTHVSWLLNHNILPCH